MKEYDAFCEVFGYTLINKILSEFLVMKNLDLAIGDLAKDLKISKPKAYEIAAKLEKKGIIKKTRIVGKTQLYALNNESPISKVLDKSFMACLKMVVDQHAEKPISTSSGRIGVASAKHT